MLPDQPNLVIHFLICLILQQIIYRVVHRRFEHRKSHVNFEMAKYWLPCKFWRKIVKKLFEKADMMNPCAEFEYILISQSQVIQLNVMAKLQNFRLGNTVNTSK